MKNKRFLSILIVLLSLGVIVVFPVSAQEEHKMEHPGHLESHSMDMKGIKADEYIVSYSFMTIPEHYKMMAEMKIDMSKVKTDPNASHHFLLELSDEKGGQKIYDAKVKIKVIDPTGKAVEKWVEVDKEMKHYGCDLEMKAKGKYGVIILFKTKDEKTHLARFWYEVK